MEVGGSHVARFDLEPNEYGEIRAHAVMPAMTNGEYFAAVKLVSADGAPLGDEFYHDVGFIIDTSSVPEDLPWPIRRQQALEALCPAAKDCIAGEEGKAGCSGRGLCQRGVCICDGDYAGQWCEHALLENSTYMPENDPAEWAGRCVAGLWWHNGSEALLDGLVRAARRTTCSPHEVLLFRVSARPPSAPNERAAAWKLHPQGIFSPFLPPNQGLAK